MKHMKLIMSIIKFVNFVTCRSKRFGELTDPFDTLPDDMFNDRRY